jgi:hypothetical protein
MKKLAAGLALAAIVLAGCGAPATVVGKWNVALVEGGPNQPKMEMEFIAPDDMKTTFYASPGMTIKIVGKFKQEGDVFRTIALDAKAEFSGMGAAAAEQKFAMEKGEYLGKANQDGNGKIMWEGPDRFKYIPDRMKTPFTVFTRIK